MAARDPGPDRDVGFGLVVLAYAIVYIVWGSTYLAIAVAVESLPPFLMAGVRFVAAGAILYVLARLRGAPRPGLEDWRDAIIVGGLMLAVGNGLLSFVETRMPTGLASLIVATVPVWVVALVALQDRRAPRPAAWAGIGLGLAGLAVLTRVEAGWKDGEALPLYVALLVLGAMAWAWGSMVSRRSRVASLRLRTGMQMLAGGGILLTVAWFRGEHAADWSAVTPASWWALAYLVVFGAVLTFTSYIWLMKTRPPAEVSTYAFVNPIVAVVLGVVVLGEPLTWRVAVAAVLVLAGVVLINRTGKARVPSVTPEPT